jgi:hypothetical protein
MSHSKGPWKVVFEDWWPKMRREIRSEHQDIAIIRSVKEFEANARLIAAAPDLLNAAKHAQAICTTVAFPTEAEWARVVKILDEAILKAEKD